VDPQKSFVGQFTHHNFSKKNPLLLLRKRVLHAI